MSSTTTRTIEQIVTDHTAIIGKILDRELPADVTADQFIALTEEAADFTGRLYGSYMEHASDDLGAVVTYLTDAADLDDGPEKQTFLNAAHKKLNALDPTEFLY